MQFKMSNVGIFTGFLTPCLLVDSKMIVLEFRGGISCKGPGYELYGFCF